MTKRQWVILQVALLHLKDAVQEDGSEWWDEDADGEQPEADEIDRLAEVVGRMNYS